MQDVHVSLVFLKSRVNYKKVNDKDNGEKKDSCLTLVSCVAATASVLASENNTAASTMLDERPTNIMQDSVQGTTMLVSEDKIAAPTASLDELFRKTKATPHLYYLPVSEEIAQKRLEDLRQKTA